MVTFNSLLRLWVLTNLFDKVHYSLSRALLDLVYIDKWV